MLQISFFCRIGVQEPPRRQLPVLLGPVRRLQRPRPGAVWVQHSGAGPASASAGRLAAGQGAAHGREGPEDPLVPDRLLPEAPAAGLNV